MKSILLFLFLAVVFSEAAAQFYYKDYLLPKQTADQIQKYRQYNIRTVIATSAENNPQAEGSTLQVRQTINGNYSQLTTITASPVTGESVLTTWLNEKGSAVKTVDTTDGSGSTTTYVLNDRNMVEKIINQTSSPGHITEKEEHHWFYGRDGKPLNMWKIRNDKDTTYVTFEYDQQGNVIEEKSTRLGKPLTTVYYYYDDQNRLTDIVRYNPIAKRLLPDYIFEYNSNGQLRSMMVVPASGSDYHRWMYTYDERGLKTKETVLNKNRQVIGTVEYKYD